MKKYLVLLIASLAGFAAQASVSRAWATEVYSNFQISADTLETPQEIVIKNIFVSFRSNLRGELNTDFVVLRGYAAGEAKAAALNEVCHRYGANGFVSYAKSDLVFNELVLAFDSDETMNFDFYWVSPVNAYKISQIVCRK